MDKLPNFLPPPGYTQLHPMYFLPWMTCLPQPAPSAVQPSEAKLDSRRKYKRTWSRQQVEHLYAVSKEHAEAHGKTMEELQLEDFELITNRVEQSPAQCLNKLQEVLATGTLRAGVWSVEEDSLLRELIQENKTRWSEISYRLNTDMHKGLQVRSGKQCKERWNNHLNPHINRGEWTLEEDVSLLELFQNKGNRWSLIAKEVPSRTESSIKNRIKSLVNKAKQDLTTLEKPDDVLRRLIMKKKLKLTSKVVINLSASPVSGKHSKSAGMSFGSIALGKPFA